MISSGALEDPKVDAVFGLHVFPFPVGQIQYRPGGMMASSDSFRIEVEGSQSHGALPWMGVDPIVVSAQIVLGLQSIVSRQIDLTASPAVITIGSIQGGVRSNIIPGRAVMEGTIRTFDPKIQQEIHARIRRTAELIAQSADAKARVEINLGNPVTRNDPDLTKRMVPTLERAAGRSNVTIVPATTTAEDFSLYGQKVPAMFFFLGVTPKGTDPAKAAPNHSPKFFADESALPLGVRVLVNLAVDFLNEN